MKAGAVIFMKTEGWAFGTSIYFCNHLTACLFFGHCSDPVLRFHLFQHGRIWLVLFSILGLSFTLTTIHAGDYAPETEIGRAIFVVWSLLGVATMTILISSMAVITIFNCLLTQFCV